MISIGVSATALAGVVLLLVAYFATTLNPEDAEKRVRRCTQNELSQRHVKMLREKGLEIPGIDASRQWKEAIEQSSNLNFVSVRVKRPLLDILFSETPTYVVQVTIGDENGQYSTRYFWLSGDGVDREISRFAWFVSM